MPDSSRPPFWELTAAVALARTGRAELPAGETWEQLPEDERSRLLCRAQGILTAARHRTARTGETLNNALAEAAVQCRALAEAQPASRRAAQRER